MAIDQTDRAELRRRFEFHASTPITAAKHGETRGRLRAVALWLLDNVPESRERTLALTHLQAAMMWSNAAIAIHTGPEPDHDQEDQA